MNVRRNWIHHKEPLTVAEQCELASDNSSTLYLPSIVLIPDAEEPQLVELIHKKYTQHPVYGSHKIKHYLLKKGYNNSHKWLQRLMRMLGQAGTPGTNTRKPHPEYKIDPYLLRGVTVSKSNQIWSSDISYLRFPMDFMYIVTVIDWYSRKVLSWRLSNSMESTFCINCLQKRYGNMGLQKFSILIGVPSLRVLPLSMHFLNIRPSVLAWMNVVGHWKISLSNSFGVA